MQTPPPSNRREIFSEKHWRQDKEKAPGRGLLLGVYCMAVWVAVWVLHLFGLFVRLHKDNFSLRNIAKQKENPLKTHCFKRISNKLLSRFELETSSLPTAACKYHIFTHNAEPYQLIPNGISISLDFCVFLSYFHIRVKFCSNLIHNYHPFNYRKSPLFTPVF